MRTWWHGAIVVAASTALGCGGPRPHLSDDSPSAARTPSSSDQYAVLVLHPLNAHAVHERAKVVATDDDDDECPPAGPMNCATWIEGGKKHYDVACIYACQARRDSMREESAQSLLGGAMVRMQ